MSPDHWLKRADRTLLSASLLLDNGDPNGACSNAYYAMFYAARAALIHVGEHERALGKTHSGMVASFNQFVVRTELVRGAHGTALANEFHRRLIADYDVGGVDEASAREAIASAEQFVAAVSELVEINED